MRRFEYRDGKSAKCWTIELRRREFTVSFGKIGSAGQSQLKQFTTEAAARKAYDKLVAEKLAKGCTETTAAPAPAPQPGKGLLGDCWWAAPRSFAASREDRQCVLSPLQTASRTSSGTSSCRAAASP
jgi:predicted DNA-binding WGR domain protein